MADSNQATTADKVEETSEMETSPISDKGKGKAPAPIPAQEMGADDDEESSEEESAHEDQMDDVEEADDDDLAEIDTGTILERRTRGKTIDFAKAAEEAGDEDDDEEDDEDFEDPDESMQE